MISLDKLKYLFNKANISGDSLDLIAFAIVRKEKTTWIGQEENDFRTLSQAFLNDRLPGWWE